MVGNAGKKQIIRDVKFFYRKVFGKGAEFRQIAASFLYPIEDAEEVCHAEKKRVECPWHKSFSDMDGKVSRGPANKAIRVYETLLQEEKVKLPMDQGHIGKMPVLCQA